MNAIYWNWRTISKKPNDHFSRDIANEIADFVNLHQVDNIVKRVEKVAPASKSAQQFANKRLSVLNIDVQ